MSFLLYSLRPNAAIMAHISNILCRNYKEDWFWKSWINWVSIIKKQSSSYALKIKYCQCVLDNRLFEIL